MIIGDDMGNGKDAVAGLSDKVLQKYRSKRKSIGTLKTRERLLFERDIPILNEIVNTKNSNPSLFYSTIIDMIVKKYFQAETLVNTIFENNNPDSIISDKFFELCRQKNISDDLIQDFFSHANAIADFFNHADERALANHFNSTIDILISAFVCHSS